MICIRSINALRSQIAKEKHDFKTIGFVPTMGALHEGHISLIKQAKAENAICVASIFVNPLQFNNIEDFNKYPIQQEKDIALMEQAGCDILFIPEVSEFYPTQPSLSIDVGILDRVLEGAHRPGHFSGVAVVVSKLFNTVNPNNAYFGQKDLQQVAVIKLLVKELNFPIEVIACPIVREKNGLAMSSRNMRLSDSGQTSASNLFVALSLMEKAILQGEKNIQNIISAGKTYLNNFEEIKIEYLEVVNSTTLETIDIIENFSSVAICIAAHIEEVRLIDNIVIIL